MSLFDSRFKRNASPTNPELERAMNAVAMNDNPKTRESLYKAVLASTLIVQGNVAGGVPASQGKRIADANTRIAFHTIEHPAGHVVLPAFTNVEALSSFAGPEAQWVGLKAQELFQSIAPSNVAEVRVNPFRQGQTVGRPGGIVTRNEFTALAQGLMPGPQVSSNTSEMKIATGQKMLIGKPAHEPPAELLTSLASHFKHLPQLQAAYLFQMANGGQSTTVVGLHFAQPPDASEMEQIMRGIGTVVRGQIPPQMSLDFMPLKDGSLLDGVRRSGRVLFTK